MGAPPFADIRLQSATMAANNSDNLKPKPATSHINTGYYYGSDSNNSEAAKNDQADEESDSDGDRQRRSSKPWMQSQRIEVI